jgi:hypothetical protein
VSRNDAAKCFGHLIAFTKDVRPRGQSQREEKTNMATKKTSSKPKALGKTKTLKPVKPLMRNITLKVGGGHF